ncbi:hypothetical protein MKX54_12640 [Alkalihalobacillus sp. FSL R5-0424]
MNKYRVTKYNPANRDQYGIYTDQEEWISYHDIGKQQGKSGLLTVEEYVHIEQLYVEAIVRFMKLHSIESLRVTKLERYEDFVQHFDSRTTPEMKRLFSSVKDKDQLSIPEIKSFAKLILRELLWAQLEMDECMMVSFGFDYYMYLYSDEPIHSFKRRMESRGLFVERMPDDVQEEDEENE